MQGIIPQQVEAGIQQIQAEKLAQQLYQQAYAQHSAANIQPPTQSLVA